jgi:polyketide biosynthesis acyl carrier protein
MNAAINQHAILDIIIGHAREVLPALGQREIGGADSLRLLGANSVDRSEIIMMSLESLELDIPLMIMARAENIGELADIMLRKLQGD